MAFTPDLGPMPPHTVFLTGPVHFSGVSRIPAKICPVFPIMGGKELSRGVPLWLLHPTRFFSTVPVVSRGYPGYIPKNRPGVPYTGGRDGSSHKPGTIDGFSHPVAPCKAYSSPSFFDANRRFDFDFVVEFFFRNITDFNGSLRWKKQMTLP
jgi:hypothetical protein